MNRLSKRARNTLALIAVIALAAVAGILVAAFQPGHAAATSAKPGNSAPAPASPATTADLARMQAALNSGLVSAQAALLPPGSQFASGSSPVFAPGSKVTIEQGTFRSDGQFAQVRADVSGQTWTLGLYWAQGHWRLYAVQQGTVTTSARVTGTVRAELTDETAPVQRACSVQTRFSGTPVILIHGFEEGPSIWDTLYPEIYDMPGTWATVFSYAGWPATQWVTNPAVGPEFADYIRCVAQASKASGGPGKVIIVAHSMGGLATRWAATKGGVSQYIGSVITIGTPNTGSFLATAGVALYPLACDGSQSRLGLSIGLLTSICEGFNAEKGMLMYGSDIDQLPELPASIPLHAIAGNETILTGLGLASLVWPTFGDVAVLQSSALSPRGGTTYWCVMRNGYQGPCWHNLLPSNQAVDDQVKAIIWQYIQAHPAPQPAPSTGQAASCDGPSPPCVQFVAGGDNPNEFGGAPWSGVEPSWMAFSGDSTLYIAHITWQTWDEATTAGSSATATGTGYWEANNCQPDCAGGAFTPTPVTLTLSDPEWFGNGEIAWHTLTVSQLPPGAAAQGTTFTWAGAYPNWWPPRAGTSSTLSPAWPT